jgi:hypothetical protein
VLEWLSWKPGNGKDIIIGIDPMVGAHRYYKLSKNILQTGGFKSYNLENS